MSQAITFFTIGLGSGGIYALLAIGIVLIYRSSGVLNFANGAMALFGAAVFFECRAPLGTVGAIIVATTLGAVLGIVVQLLVMRPLRLASPLTRVVAMLGLMTLIDSIAQLHFGPNALFVSSFLPTKTISLGSASMGTDRLIILGIASALTAVLSVVYARTRFGLATTAVSENELVAAALGWSPGRVAVANWAVSGALAAAAGTLLVPIAGLSPTGLTLAIIPALAASLVGGFSSFGLTLLGGLLIGVLQSEATHYITTPGWDQAVPFLVILGILIVRGKGLPLRSHIAERLPRLGRGTIPLPTLVLLLAVTGGVAAISPNWAAAVTSSAIVGLVALSLVVVTGYCGQISLAQWSLAGVAALISSRLAQLEHIPFLLALLAGVVLTVPIGILIALPAVRTRGANLAVATLGVATVITSVVLTNTSLTGGPVTGTVIAPPEIFGLSVYSVTHPLRYAVLAVVVLLLGVKSVANLRRSIVGRRMIAVRSNERAAASLGINVAGMKVYAFAVGSVLTALGGVLVAFNDTHVDFSVFDVFTNINDLLFAVIGGIGYVGGAAVSGVSAQGGVSEQVLSEFFTVTNWYLVITSAALLVVILLNPNGVVDAMRLQTKWLLQKLGRAQTTIPAGGGYRLRDVAESTAPPRVPAVPLELRRVTVAFGGVVALADVSLTVRSGEIVGLIGPNGAGKTTLVDAATGFVRPTGGQVLLGGVNVTSSSPTHRSQRGLLRSFQSLELFEDLTVLDNLRTAADPRQPSAYATGVLRPQRTRLTEAGEATVREFGLADVLEAYPRDLPYAQRHLVAIARAVAASPSVLLLDEPAAGLDARSTVELATLARRLARDWGLGILLIEHDVSMVMELCDRVVVLQGGCLLAEGTPEEVRADSRVVEAYLGAGSAP